MKEIIYSVLDFFNDHVSHMLLAKLFFFALIVIVIKFIGFLVKGIKGAVGLIIGSIAIHSLFIWFGSNSNTEQSPYAWYAVYFILFNAVMVASVIIKDIEKHKYSGVVVFTPIACAPILLLPFSGNAYEVYMLAAWSFLIHSFIGFPQTVESLVRSWLQNRPKPASAFTIKKPNSLGTDVGLASHIAGEYGEVLSKTEGIIRDASRLPYSKSLINEALDLIQDRFNHPEKYPADGYTEMSEEEINEYLAGIRISQSALTRFFEIEAKDKEIVKYLNSKSVDNISQLNNDDQKRYLEALIYIKGKYQFGYTPKTGQAIN